MCFPHNWKWEPARWVGAIDRMYVQYGTCTKCGKAKAREILVG